MTTIIMVLMTIGFIASMTYLVQRHEKPRSSGGSKSSNQPMDRKTKLKHAIANSCKIVAAYGAVLEQDNGQEFQFSPESALPYSKAEIRAALELQLMMEKDVERLASLEVCDIFLSQFIPDDEYRMVSKQQAGFFQAVENFRAGERDTTRLADMILTDNTPEYEAKLHELEERVRHEDEITLQRHRKLREQATQLQQ